MTRPDRNDFASDASGLAAYTLALETWSTQLELELGELRSAGRVQKFGVPVRAMLTRVLDGEGMGMLYARAENGKGYVFLANIVTGYEGADLARAGLYAGAPVDLLLDASGQVVLTAAAVPVPRGAESFASYWRRRFA